MDFLFGLLGSSDRFPWILGSGPRSSGTSSSPSGSRSGARGPSRDDLLAKILGPGWTRGSLENRSFQSAERKAGPKLSWEPASCWRTGAGWPTPPRPTLRRAGVPGRRRRPSRRWAAPKGRRALPCRPATSRRGGALHPGRQARRARRRSSSRRGTTCEAARLYARASQWATAAELYEKSGYPLRAAEAWEKDGKPLKAAEAYEKHFAENVSFSTSFSQGQGTQDSKSARLAGRMFEQANQLERARHHLLPRRLTFVSRGRSAAEARPGREGRRALPAGRGHPEGGRCVRAGRRSGPRAATLRGEHALRATSRPRRRRGFVQGATCVPPSFTSRSG